MEIHDYLYNENVVNFFINVKYFLAKHAIAIILPLLYELSQILSLAILVAPFLGSLSISAALQLQLHFQYQSVAQNINKVESTDERFCMK